MQITLQNKVLTWWIILYFLSVALKNLIKMLECSEFTGSKIKSVWNLVYHDWVEVSPWESPYSTWHPLLDILCLIPFSLALYACANLQDLFRNSCVKGRFSWFFSGWVQCEDMQHMRGRKITKSYKTNYLEVSFILWHLDTWSLLSPQILPQPLFCWEST